MRRILPAVAAAVALAAALAAAGPAAGQDDDGPDVRLELASQTPWVRPEGEMVLRLDLDGRDVPDPPAPGAPPTAGADLDLVVEVHDRLTSRSAFGLTLQGTNLGRTLATTRAPLSGLGRDATGAVVVRLGVTAGGGSPAEDEAPRLRLRREGVYPVSVQVERSGEVVDRFVTHLVRVPDDDSEPLGVSLVVPVHAPPAFPPEGPPRLAVADRRRLADLVGALAGAARPGVVLAPTPETVAAVAAAGDDGDSDELLSRLRERAGDAPVNGGPWVPVDPLELVAAGLGDELDEQLAVGDEALRRHLRVTPESGTWLARTPVDPVSVSALRRAGVERLVVEEATLEPIDLPLSLTGPFLLDGVDGRRTVALAADAGLAAHLTTGSSPVLAAHHFLADAAVLFFDEPGVRRAVVARAPDEWTPSPLLVESLLSGLANSPILDVIDLETAADAPLARSDDGDALVRRPLPVDPAGSSSLEGVRSVRDSLASLDTMLPDDVDVLGSVEQRLLAAESIDLTGGQQAALVASAAAVIDRQLALVEVPARRAITLTSRTGEIPVTLRNDAPHPVEVAVSLDADQLGFPDGKTARVVLPGGNETIQFEVQARTSGAFPLRVRVTSPDGRLVLGETRYTIRSTVVSGVGLALTGGSVAFLAAWWALHLRKERRRKARER